MPAAKHWTHFTGKFRICETCFYLLESSFRKIALRDHSRFLHRLWIRKHQRAGNLTHSLGILARYARASSYPVSGLR